MKIKGYRIEKEIHQGPITTAYLAVQVELERQVLLKVLNVQWQKDRELVERFRREAKIYARLKHPNIVTVFDFGIDRGRFFLAMEYVEGMNLAHFIQKYQPLPFPVIHYITGELLKALAYAHEKGVIHRDIKPSNIIIGKLGEVKIADFGLATGMDFPGLTAEDMTLGTPAYMAPEQATGQKIDVRSDLFSLGVTVYEMGSGESPFSEANMAGTIQKILNFHPEPLHMLRQDIPTPFSEIVDRCIQKDPVRRPSSASEILSDPVFQTRLLQASDLQEFQKFPDKFRTPPFLPSEKTATPIPKKKTKFLPFLVLFLSLVLLVLYWRMQKGNSRAATMDQQKTESVSTAGDSPPETVQRGIADKSAQSPESVAPTPPSSQNVPQIEKNTETPEAEAYLEKATADKESTNGDVPRAEAVAGTPGGLWVVCNPWADIYIDGEFRERTPITTAITLPAGEHKIELRNEYFQPFLTRIQIQPGVVESLRVVLQPIAGKVTFRVIPWGEVFIDGESIGITPILQPVELPPGPHTIRIRHPEFGEMVDTIQIRSGETVEKFYRLTK